jgi:hypothetical protein
MAFVFVVAFGKMVQLTYISFASGTDIFMPGVTVLMLVVLLAFIASARLAVKNFKALVSNGEERARNI